MHTILLATDGSPSAKKATTTAIELAKATGWKLRVVAVWQIPVYEYGYLPLQYTPELIEAASGHAATVVKEAVKAAQQEGVAATSELRQGYPIDEICAAAAETSADLIVLGAHGWGALKRILFGSVSTAVLHSAPCPVLVVRDEAEPQEERELVGVGAAHADGD
jgi:nucleotide-binding universal stress UspA family protein